MTPRQRRLTADEAERVLKENGFVLVSQRGSHRKWFHTQQRKQVIVPRHGNQPLPIGTLKAIISGSGLPAEVWA